MTAHPLNCIQCKHLISKDKKSKYGIRFIHSCRLLKNFKKDCSWRVEKI